MDNMDNQKWTQAIVAVVAIVCCSVVICVEPQAKDGMIAALGAAIAAGLGVFRGSSPKE